MGWHVYALLLTNLGEPWKLVRTPLAGGPLAIVVDAPCPVSEWIPSIAASTTTLFIAGPADGGIRVVVPPSP